MIDNRIIKREFCSQNSKINTFQKKIAHLEKSKKFRSQELEKMPETRKAIKEKAKELYDKSTEYRLKGFDRKYRSLMNQGSVEIKRLKAISRYRKRKEIHNLNRDIRELESRIRPIREDQINQESTIKDILFQEFIQCNVQKGI